MGGAGGCCTTIKKNIISHITIFQTLVICTACFKTGSVVVQTISLASNFNSPFHTRDEEVNMTSNFCSPCRCELRGDANISTGDGEEGTIILVLVLSFRW